MERGFRVSTIFRVVLAIIVILAVAGVLFACMDENSNSLSSMLKSDNTVFPEGTTLSGENISGMSADEAIVVGHAYLDKVKNNLEINIKFNTDTVVLKGDDFSSNDILERQVPTMLSGGVSGAQDISYVLDLAPAGKEKIIAAAKTSYIAGKNATVDSYDAENDKFIFKDGEKGSRADIDSTLKNVRQMLSQKMGGNLQAAFMEITPKMAMAELESKFVRLATYSSESTNTWNGNSNMALALSHINGTIMQPGQVFSYNDAIGDSTSTAAGYLPAGGIINGILVDVIGGGICQGSSTLYNAVMLAGLEIVERECHSRESSYVPTGRDATVDYGNIDFKFRNNLENPIYLMCWMEGVTLYTNIYGVQPEEWDSIEIYSERVNTIGALNTVSFVNDQALKQGEYVRRTSGNTGVESITLRTFYKNGEQVKQENMPNSFYPPSGVIYAIGPGTDTTKIDTSKEGGTIDGSPSPSPSVSPPPESPSPDPGIDPTPGVTDTPPPETPTPTPTPTPEPTPVEWPDDQSNPGGETE